MTRTTAFAASIFLRSVCVALCGPFMWGCESDGGARCEGDTASCGDGSADTDSDVAQPEVTPETRRRAIIVDDDGLFQNHRQVGSDPCLTSSSGAHGADIDAVALFEADGTTLVSYFASVRGKAGTTCSIAPAFSDATAAIGAPDGTLTGQFFSLGGGAISGSFEADLDVVDGDVLVVYVVGACGDGVDDAYHVFVADTLDCIDRNRSTCAVRITKDAGAKCQDGISLSGF